MSNLTKAFGRQELSRLCGDWWPIVTSADGAADGSTFVAAQFNGWGDNSFQTMWALLTSGAFAGHYFLVALMVGSTAPATFTLAPAAGGTIVAGTTIELHAWRPDYYTEAFARAVRQSKDSLYVASMDSSIALAQDQFAYALPAGVTPEIIGNVMTDGVSAPFVGIPYSTRDDVTYSPDGTTLWFNRTNTLHFINFSAGQTCYLFLRKYLTPFDLDTVYGQLTTDTTPRLELDPTTKHWELLLLVARVMLYEVLAAQPATDRKGELLALAKGFAAVVEAVKPRFRMKTGTENPYAAF